MVNLIILKLNTGDSFRYHIMGQDLPPPLSNILTFMIWRPQESPSILKDSSFEYNIR